MKVQRVRDGNGIHYLLLDDEYRVVDPVHNYLKFLTPKASPNTVRVYCFHLKYYFQFLNLIGLPFDEVGTQRKSFVRTLTEYIGYLLRKEPGTEDSDSYDDTQSGSRSFSTVNLYISTVLGFYDYLVMDGVLKQPDVYKYHRSIPRYRGRLAELRNVNAQVQVSVLRIKTARPIPKHITRSQYDVLRKKCKRYRDKLLLAIMFECGLRIGEVLGLHLEDIVIWENRIYITARENLENEARVKDYSVGKVYAPPYVMKLYLTYLERERGNITSDFVFVNYHGKNVGKPVRHSTVQHFITRLCEGTGIKAHPHMFRHGFATEKYMDGADMKVIQQALRHRYITTTMDTYVHLESFKAQEKIQQLSEKRVAQIEID